MTKTHRTRPPTAAARHRRPFTLEPGRWEAERSRALRTGHVRDSTCTAECELVLVYERSQWGWLAWTVPADGSPPELPHGIGVLPPDATRTDRLALRWLTRRPARRIGLAASIPGSLRYTAAVLALVGCAAALHALGHDVPADIAWPTALLPPAARRAPAVPTGHLGPRTRPQRQRRQRLPIPAAPRRHAHLPRPVRRSQQPL